MSNRKEKNRCRHIRRPEQAGSGRFCRFSLRAAVSLLCAAFLLTLSLAGCGASSSGATDTAKPAESSSASGSPADEKTADPSSASGTPADEKPADSSGRSASAKPAESSVASDTDSAVSDNTAPGSGAAGSSAVSDPAAGSSADSENQAPGSGSSGSSAVAEPAADTGDGSAAETGVSDGSSAEIAQEEPRLLKYIDAWKEWHTMEVNPSVRENVYDPEGFVYNDETGQMTYTGPLTLPGGPSGDSAAAAGSTADVSASGSSDGAAAAAGTQAQSNDVPYEVLQGVDVSEHQGYIDWNAVAEAGYRFAFIRVGYRGYGEAGNVFEDGTAVDNLQAAQAAGLQVGAYFFSQALNEEEAREEAAVALNVIRQSGVELDLPLMYDPEIIKDDWGRANDITREQVTINTAAFRDAVESESSLQVDIYSNLPWEHNYFDGDTLNQYEIWYADYEQTPQTPYHFVWWQYTNEGYVPGIDGRVDLNLWIRAD